MDDNQFWVSVWIVIGVVVVIIGMFIHDYYVKTTTLAMTNGYEKRAIQGTSIPRWQKVD